MSMTMKQLIEYDQKVALLLRNTLEAAERRGDEGAADHVRILLGEDPPERERVLPERDIKPRRKIEI